MIEDRRAPLATAVGGFPAARRGPRFTSIGYALMIAAGIGAFAAIRRQGATLVATGAPAGIAPADAAAAGGDILLHVLAALAAVIATGWVLSRLLARLGQPPVIGEVLAGIALGPSLLGPRLSGLILPPDAAPYLGLVAQLGVLLYIFIIGLDLHADLVRGRATATIATSHASIVAPFVLGALTALWIYPRFASRDVPFTSFALFMGVAMSITAFPVLARILADTGLIRTELGVIALSCAAIDDVTAWCLLAFATGVAQARVGAGLVVAAATLAYIVVMLALVRPLLGRIVTRWNTEVLPRAAVAFVFVALLLSALATEAIGIHAIFGAFLLGAVIPSDSAVARSFARQLEPVVTVLLLPAFFAFTGMRTRIDLVTGPHQWLVCGLLIAVATVGKFGGTYAAARLTGLATADAAALGVLMNTRGLMELIVLNVGLDLGVISPTLFSMLVLMALVTTIATAPLLRALRPAG